MKKLMILLVLLFTASAIATVPEGESIRQYFTCNGSTTTFTFTQPVNSADDVLVYDHIIATGVETLLVEDTDYTIVATGGNYLNGGVVTISPALESTSRVVIVRNIKKSQETSSGAMSAAAAVLAFDKLTRIVQDLEDRKDRSIRLQESDASTFDLELADLETRASTYLGMDDTGNLTYFAAAITDGATVSSFATTYLDDPTAITTMATLQGIPVINVMNPTYGTTGGGSVDDSAAIDLAVTAATGKWLVFGPGTYKLSNSVTIDSTVTLVMVRGAQFSIDSGKVLTIAGEYTAGPYQTFSGSGTVVFSKAVDSGFLVEWWGGVADDTANNSVPLQALETSIDTIGGDIVFQSGTYLFEDPVYFDSATNDIKFTFRGQGFKTVLHLNDAALDSDFLLYLNETVGGATGVAFPGLRFEVRDLKVLGDTTQTLKQSFIKLNNSYFSMTNVEMEYLLYGVRATQVCDNVTFRNVQFALQTPIGTGPVTEGSYLYRNTFAGDGLLLDSCAVGSFHEFNGMAKLSGNAGAVFNSCVNGTYDLLNCVNVTFLGCHLETYKSVPGINIQSSNVGIYNTQLWSYLRNVTDTPTLDFPGVVDQYPIQIDDEDGTIEGSQVSVMDCTFVTKHETATSHKTKPEIFIFDETVRTHLVLKNNKSAFQIDGTKMGISGITVSATDAGLATVLSDNRGLMSASVVILNTGNTWKVANSEGDTIVESPLLTTTPDIFALAQEISTPVGDLDASTEYFYRMACLNLKGQTIKSDEESITTDTLGNKTGAVRMSSVGFAPYSTWRIWRGLSADTYDRFVDIPMVSGATFLYDNGDNVNGYLWVTAGVPTPQTVNTNTTFTDADTSPSVIGGRNWFTGTTGATFLRFDDGFIGQEITVISKGAIVFDVDGNLLEAGSTDLTTASGDVTMWVCESTATSTTNVWRLIAYMDNTANQN